MLCRHLLLPRWDARCGDFKELAREPREFKLGGSTYYYVVVVFTAITWQGFFLGSIGMIFCASSLVSGVLISALLPLTEVWLSFSSRRSFRRRKVSLCFSPYGDSFLTSMDSLKPRRRLRVRRHNCHSFQSLIL